MFWGQYGDDIKFLFVSICVVVSLFFVCSAITDKVCEPLLYKIHSMGYDEKEVRIFLYRIDTSLENFIESEGIRKQYEIFRNGESSEFIKLAENKKRTDDAKSTGMATGLACGMAMRAGR